MADQLPYYPSVETHLITSKHVAQTFKIQVMRPPQTRGETTRFPVVYATDGNLTFDMFKGISNTIQAPDGLRYILVSIGYPSDSPAAGTSLRARDLTFPRYPRLALKQRYEDALMPAPGTKDFYGAEDFQRFIAEELIPLIDATYPTIPGERSYFGHSAGGGFGLYTMFYKTDLFKRYICSSPGLIFHGEGALGHVYDNYDFVLQDARTFMASGKALDGITLYLSVGTDEEIPLWNLTSSYYRMAALLKSAPIPGLNLITQVFPGENHSTVWPVAFMHGVRAVLADAKP